MADQFIQVPVDSTGKKVDTSELTVNLQTVERQRIVLADDATAAALAKVQNADPGATDYGLTVRTVAGTAAKPMVVSGVMATGGYTTKHAVAAASTNATSVKASAGQVYGWSVYNAAAYPIYVKLHNTAGVPTAGAGVVQTIGVQAGTGAQAFNTSGIAFSTGIGFTIVKDIADAGTTVVALNDCVLDLFYA